MKMIGSLLWQSLRRAGIEKEVAAVLVCQEFEKLLEKKFGDKIKNRVKVLSLKNQTLNLSVLSSVLSQEIKLNEKKFLQKINKKFGKKLVNLCRFVSN